MDAKPRPKSSKSASSDRAQRARGLSPYSQNYKVPIPHCKRHLINQHLVATKLSRTDLEDRYLVLCDENYRVKHEKRELEDKLKLMSARMMRFSSAGAQMKKFKSVDGLSHSSKENDEDEGRPWIRNQTRPFAPLRRVDQRLAEVQIELEKVKTENEDLLKKMSELETKCKELDEKLFEETKKVVTFTMECKSHKRKAEKYEMQVKHMKEEKREIEKKLDSLSDEHKRKLDILKSELDDEKQTSERFKEKSVEINVAKKQILELREQILQLQVEKSSAAVQKQNFADLIEEAARARNALNDTQTQIEILTREVQYERTEKEALRGTQTHLLEKVKEIQNMNDQLIVEIEGLKGKVEYFTNENVSLELRLRDVEANRTELQRRLDSKTKGSTDTIFGNFRKSVDSFEDSMKEMLLTKINSVTFEPWEQDQTKGSPASRSRRSSVASISKSDIKPVPSSSAEESPKAQPRFKLVTADVHQVPVVEKTQRRRPSIPRQLSVPETEPVFDSKIDSELNESLINRVMQYKNFDLSLDDTIVDRTDEIEDEDPMRSINTFSEQAELAAQKLIRDIKKSAIGSEIASSSTSNVI